MSEEQLEQMKKMMKSRGMTDEQIEERIKMMKSGQMPSRPPQRPPGE